MGIIEAVELKIEKVIKKALQGAATAIVAVIADQLAKHLGLQLSPEQQLALVGFVAGLIVGLTNWLKTKYPKIFGWL